MPRNEITIKISGEAGRGAQTIGDALCRALKRQGLNIFADQDYMSRIRGGNNFYRIRVSSEPVYSPRENEDLFVDLDKPAISADGSTLDIPLGDKFVNSSALGAVACITGIAFDSVEKELRSAFSKKEKEVIDQNIAAAKAGYEAASAPGTKGRFAVTSGPAPSPLIMDGNSAIALGAIRSGCKFYSAYPMTPSTTIMDTIAHYADKFGIIVEQAEDEIAAINMAIGASFAGVRSMTSTSGGGFALMVEGVSLAGMTETPVVVVDAQRPAPATGFPTRTEQADLDFVLHAGHGEFAKAVFAPGTVEEAFHLTVRAFNLAEKYQIPVLILTDQHLADSTRNVEASGLNAEKVSRAIVSKEGSRGVRGYKRYALNDTGISPRAVPSWIDDVIYADSDEHTEEGHITEDAAVRVSMVEKRFHKKMAGLSKETVNPKAEGDLGGADIILAGFGSTYGVIKEACESIKGRKIGRIHLSQVWPFPSEGLSALLKGPGKLFTVENNAAGQLARLIRRETGIKADGSILKYDGRPFDLDYLVRKIEEAL